MFERAKAETSQTRRQDLIRQAVIDLVENGLFFYTPVLLEAEPFKQFALMAIDGLRLNGSTIQPGESAIPIPDVRLLAVSASEEKQHKIRYKLSKIRAIPGAMNDDGSPKTERVTEYVYKGHDATLPHKVARDILRLSGWPVVNSMSMGNRNGGIVEVEWIKHAIKQPECNADVLAMYERLKDRIEKGTTPKRAPTHERGAGANA